MKKLFTALLLSIAISTTTVAAKPLEEPVQPQKQEEALKVGEQAYNAYCVTSTEYRDFVKTEGLRLALAGNHPGSGNYIMILTDLGGKAATIAEVQADGRTVCILTNVIEYAVDFMAFKPKHAEKEAVQ